MSEIPEIPEHLLLRAAARRAALAADRVDAPGSTEIPDDGTYRVTDPTTGGQKDNQLARFDLIPVRPLWLLAEHYGRSEAKYPDRNWAKGYDWSLSYTAMQRHAMRWWGGQDFDPSGSHHLIAVAWHALTLMEFTGLHPDKDNRPKMLLTAE